MGQKEDRAQSKVNLRLLIPVDSFLHAIFSELSQRAAYSMAVADLAVEMLTDRLLIKLRIPENRSLPILAKSLAVLLLASLTINFVV